VRAKSAFLLGAGTAFFFDPQEGKRRRSLVRDRSLAFVRRGKRTGVGKLKLIGGHARGFQALLRRVGRRRNVATDDQTVVQRIRSDALRDVGISTRDVEVEVENGVARLRGNVQSRSLADDLVSRVRKVPGVREVSTELSVAESSEAHR
jgi:hypothetical protein